MQNASKLNVYVAGFVLLNMGGPRPISGRPELDKKVDPSTCQGGGNASYLPEKEERKQGAPPGAQAAGIYPGATSAALPGLQLAPTHPCRSGDLSAPVAE